MPMEMHLESANVYRLELRGVLQKVELDKCLDALAAQLPGIGSVRLPRVIGLSASRVAWDHRLGSWTLSPVRTTRPPITFGSTSYLRTGSPPSIAAIRSRKAADCFGSSGAAVTTFTRNRFRL